MHRATSLYVTSLVEKHVRRVFLLERQVHEFIRRRVIGLTGNLKEKEQVFQNQSDELRSIISNCNETVKLQTSNFKNLTEQKNLATENFKTFSDANKTLFKQNNDLNNHEGLKEQNNKLNNYENGVEKNLRDKITQLKEQIHFLNKQKSENKSHSIDQDDINKNENKRIKIEYSPLSDLNYASNSNEPYQNKTQRRYF